MRKSELRQNYLSKQKALSPQDRGVRSAAISEILFETFDLSQIEYLHLFLPIEKFNEINTRLIVEEVWRTHPHIQILVPRVDFSSDDIKSLSFTPDTNLAKNAWHIDEPTHDEFVDAEIVDMVLVPGLCFDSGGHRVGYGKGFYDRFLKRCRADCKKVGLTYFEPVDKIDDTHDGDVRLDIIISPDRMYRSVPPA